MDQYYNSEIKLSQGFKFAAKDFLKIKLVIA